jgi:hypothetical protein
MAALAPAFFVGFERNGPAVFHDYGAGQGGDAGDAAEHQYEAGPAYNERITDHDGPLSLDC